MVIADYFSEIKAVLHQFLYKTGEIHLVFRINH